MQSTSSETQTPQTASRPCRRSRRLRNDNFLCTIVQGMDSKDKEPLANTSLANDSKRPESARPQRRRADVLRRERFAYCLEKNLADRLFQFANKYRPKNRSEMKERRAKAAAAVALAEKGEKVPTEKVLVFESGIHRIASLTNSNKAKLVIIAKDARLPPETVDWLPNLCRKKNVPFAIFDSKARLGTLINKKNAEAIVLTNIRAEDLEEFNSLMVEIKNHVSKCDAERGLRPSSKI